MSCQRSKIRFAAVRIVTDVIFVLTGFLLVGKFGIGTLICAFLVGPVADICMPFSKSIAERRVNRISNNNL